MSPLEHVDQPQVDPTTSAISLVEIEPGLAVLFADKPPLELDLIPFDMVSAGVRGNLVDGLSQAVGLGNLGAQVLQGAMEVQGLVRLAPESIELLRTFQPMMSDGWNLGPIVDKAGKIVAQARFAPVEGLQSVTMLSNLGTAAALLALQVQVAAISRKIDENIELTRDVLQAIHEDQWATLIGLHETTMRAVREAQAAGGVNDHVFAAIATRDADLRKQRHLFTGFVRRHALALIGDTASKRAYIMKNVEQIVADTHGMLMAEGSWYRAQVLRAGHIIRDEVNSAENEGLLTELVAETKKEHSQAMEDASDLLRTLERQCRLMAELPVEFTLPFTAKRRDIREAVKMAEALGKVAAKLRDQVRAEVTAVEPAVVTFEKEIPHDVLRILQWALPGQEPVLALADVNLDRLLGDSAYLGVTSERVFLSSHGAVRKQGEIEREFPLDSIRYVRFREREKQSPVLDIITVDENIRLTFDGWASKGEGLEKARRLGALLVAAMHLPEGERTEDPLLPAREAPLFTLMQ